MAVNIAALGVHILSIVGIAASAKVTRIAALRIIAKVHDNLSVDAVRLRHCVAQAVGQRRVAVLGEVAVAASIFAVRPRMAGIIAAAGVDVLQERLLKVADGNDVAYSCACWPARNVRSFLGAALLHVARLAHLARIGWLVWMVFACLRHRFAPCWHISHMLYAKR